MDDEAKKLLKEAEERIFSLGLRDLASLMSYQNMRYGLGRVLSVAEEAYCVFSPDSTITRNVGRWQSGFGYGGIIRWRPEGLFFPEMRPNACGMILARLEELPSKREILERISEVEKNGNLSLDGIEIKPNFGKGNHFFEFYSALRVLPELEKKIPKDGYFAIMHGSPGERKKEIYEMVERGEWKETPLGKISVLEGQEGKEYYQLWKEVSSFSRKRNELLMKEILPGSEIISNILHQGLFSKTEIRLGCYNTLDKNYPPKKALFPIALRWDHPLYIFQGKKNLSQEVIGMSGFDKRGEELGIREELENVNILPHGGGYNIKMAYANLEIIKTEIGNNFVMSGVNPVSRISESSKGKRYLSKFGEMIVTNPKELPYDYRGIRVIEKTLEYDLGIPVAMLQPLMTLKT